MLVSWFSALAFLLAIVFAVPSSNTFKGQPSGPRNGPYNNSHRGWPYNRGGIIPGKMRVQKKTRIITDASVRVWLGICSDLCRAGLGGAPCGPSCVRATPNFSKAVQSTDFDKMMVQDDMAARPRLGVCPALCKNNLGDPLCNCPAKEVPRGPPHWKVICDSFCDAEDFQLMGCLSCASNENKIKSPAGSITAQAKTLQLTNVLDDKTVSFEDDDIHGYNGSDWIQWCNYVCKMGDGGAACNCDRAPFF